MPRPYSEDLRWRAIWIKEILGYQVDEVAVASRMASLGYSTQIGRSGAEFRNLNEKFAVVCSRCQQNLESFGHFILTFCRGRQRNVTTFKTRVKLLFLLIKPFVLWRFHRCHYCRCSAL